MNSRQVRLGDAWDAIGGPLARLGSSLRHDRSAVLVREQDKGTAEALATDAFLQRFNQVTDMALRKLLPRMLAVLEGSDTRPPFAAVFDRLDGFEVLSDVPWWIALSELRNRLVHEYAMAPDERAIELEKAWHAADRLRAELLRIKDDHALATTLFGHD